MSFEGKTAVITGAGGTLCSEIAVALAKDGVKTVLVGRTSQKLELTADKIEKSGGVSAFVYPCDVTDREAVKELAGRLEKEGISCDYLINGAGGNDSKAMPTLTSFDERELKGTLPESERGLFDIDTGIFEKVIITNTMGSVIPIIEFSKQMIRKGSGSIVNFASMNSYCPLTRCFAYAMSKAAVCSMTQSFAAYLAPSGVRVNAVAPGFMVNERSKNYLGTVEDGLTKRGESVIAHTPMKRFGKADDLVGCVKWLLDDDASGFVTGITVPVDGGFLTLSGV